MESDKSEEDEHEAISKQIVEYYKKYSLSQQLPKYFSGTSLSYMPQIVKDDEINKPLIIIEDTSNKVSVEKQSDYCQTDVDEAAEPKVISPASSATSIRKLEWDSGADIGYNNCNKKPPLQKSYSLPILTGAIDKRVEEKSPKIKLTSHIVNVVSYSTTEPEKPVQSSSSSSSCRVEAPVMSSSSSSGAPPAKPPSSSSSSSARPASAKPFSSSSSSFANTLAYLKSKIGTPDAESTPKMAVSDPKTSVYSGETPFISKTQRKSLNRVVELCMTKPISIECLVGRKKKALDKRVQTSFIEKLSKSVQTGSDDKTAELNGKKLGPKENQSVIVINYDSGSDKRTYSSNTQTESELVKSSDDGRKNKLNSPSTDSSQDIPLLSQIISKKQSKSLIGDIDKSIELLQKLLKSKKYDAATKKRYIKKIVAKIVDNKYSEDSTSSSEVFQFKKPEEKAQQKLQENIPWYPPNLAKFGIKPFDDACVPESKKKKSVFTVSDSRDTPTSCNSSSTEKPPNTSSGSCPSWKEDKTLSERLLEEKQKSAAGDQLVTFAKKERQNQLAWINDEISHLTKLKGLLESKGGVHNTATTTVYMVSQAEYDRNFRSANTGSNRARRNYVIQTELSGESTSSGGGIVNFNLYDSSDEKGTKKVYEVESALSRNEKIVGDIEVVSDEQTTNIRVKARKVEDESKRPPPTAGKYDTYPRSRQEEERCWPCEMMRNRRGFVDNAQTDGPISQNAVAIMRKVDEIVSKYGSKTSDMGSDSQSGSCTCKCHCRKTEYVGLSKRCLVCCKCSKGKETGVRSNCGCVKEPAKESARDFIIKYASTEFVQPMALNDKPVTGLLKEKSSTSSKEASIKSLDNKPSASKAEESLFKPIDKQSANAQCCCVESTQVQTTPCKCQSRGVQIDKPATSEAGVLCICCASKKNLEKVDTELKIIGSTSGQGDLHKNNARPKDKSSSSSEREMAVLCCCCSDKQTQCTCSENVKVQTETEPVVEKKSCYKDSNVQCTCLDDAKVQTDFEAAKSDEALCSCCKKQTEDAGVQCSCPESTEAPESSESYDSSSTESETSTTITDTTRSCVCCKKKTVTSEELRGLRRKLSNEVYPLCRPCYTENRRCAYSYNTYSRPGYVCRCFTMVETRTLDAIKKTINELEEDMEYCSCVDDFAARSNSTCCRYCKRKLKRTSRNRNGIAYVVTFENATPSKEEKKKSKELEEIKIKIPISRKKKNKKHKDKENRRRKKSRNGDDEERFSKEPCYTLQEYLYKNRPDFVETAEGRRNSVIVSKAQREQLGDENKLKFLQNYQKNKDKNCRRLFSEREMKEITKRNYRKLPEVQQRLIDNKEKQLRQANRAIADCFNKKLRENVLKGKRSLPTTTHVVNL